MVTLLRVFGIPATEGEMAQLSLYAPGSGLSAHQAAYVLMKKFKHTSRNRRVAVEVPAGDNIGELPTSFLAGIKYSFWTNHMVCVLRVVDKGMIVGNPLSGRNKWDLDYFKSKWTGIVVTVKNI